MTDISTVLTPQHPLVLPIGQTATLENSLATINIQDPTVNIAQGLNLHGRHCKFKTPYIQTVNLTIQDQFTNHDSIQIGYVGTMGRHLDNLGYNNSPSQILPPSANPQNFIHSPALPEMQLMKQPMRQATTTRYRQRTNIK